jgi:hypothetical protein
MYLTTLNEDPSLLGNASNHPGSQSVTQLPILEYLAGLPSNPNAPTIRKEGYVGVMLQGE